MEPRTGSSSASRTASSTPSLSVPNPSPPPNTADSRSLPGERACRTAGRLITGCLTGHFPSQAPFTTEQTQTVLAAALADATERELKMNIAIVDAGGNLKAFLCQDGAWLGGIDISIKKARTARYFDMPTGTLGTLSQPGGSLFNIEVSNVVSSPSRRNPLVARRGYPLTSPA